MGKLLNWSSTLSGYNPLSLIYFFSEDTSFQLKGKNKYKKWLSAIAQSHQLSIGDLNYIFCSDEHLYKMNMDYLDHDTYTDIITFGELENTKINGDLFISVDRVKENATNNRTSFDLELARVMAHGVLHIIGYKDKTASEASEMRSQEEKSLILYEEYVVCST